MLWVVEKFKTTLVVSESFYDLKVPIQVEIEYGLEGNRVMPSTLTKKLRYNRPLLIKEAPSWCPQKLDELVEQWVERKIEQHLEGKGYELGEDAADRDP